jgi:hypothetical protein
MHYLARALPEQEVGRRYALDSTEGDPQFWRLLGIEPILFPKIHKSDYSELYNGVHQLAKHVRRGILDWQREISALAESGPPIEEASVGLIEQGLKEVATTRFFVKAARAREWIGWIEKRGSFDALFDTPTLSEQNNLLARWLAEHYAIQYPSEIFLLIGRHNLCLNSAFWWALAREVSLGVSPIDAETYSRWVSLLLATAPQEADSHPLHWLAERGAKLGDFRSVLQIFAHMAAWHLEVKTGFPWASDELAEQTARVDIHTPLQAEHWSLQEVWRKLLRPHLASLAAPILSIVVAHLQQKYATHSLWQTANREWDGDSYRRAAIEPHEQDKYSQALDVLIDAARDAMEWLAQNDASLFSAWCEQLIRAEAPLLRRLAIHGMIEYAALSWDDKLRWLLVKVEIHVSALHHEIFRLVRCAYPHAHVATRQQLIDGILAWQWPDQDDPERELRTARIHYDWLLWLHDADPVCQLVAVPLNALRQQYQQWQPHEYPDLTHWSSSGLIKPESPWSVEQLLAKLAKDWLDELMEFRGMEFLGPSRSGLLDVVSDAAKQRFVWGHELAEALAAGDYWYSDLWEALIRAWAAWNMEETDARRVIHWLNNHQLYAEHTRALVDALLDLVRNGGKPYAPDLLPTVNAIALTLWTTLERSETEATEPRDWLQKAINRPAGRLAEFWLHSLSLWRNQHIGDASSQMSDEYRQALTVIVSDNSINGGLGRTVLTSQLGFLLTLDEQWTTEHLVPLFSDGNDMRFQQAWDGILAAGTPTPQIVEILTPAFFSALLRLDSVLTARRDYFVKCYTVITGFFAERPLEDWIPKLFQVATTEDRQCFARHMEYLLRGLDEERQKEWWQRWLRQYWENRVLGTPVPLEPVEVQCMLDWLPHLPATFPEAVMLAVRMPQASFKYSHLTYTLKDSPLVEQYPDEMAQLIIFVLSCDAPTSTWHGLQELAGRLAHLPVQAALRQALIERLVERGFDISVFG